MLPTFFSPALCTLTLAGAVVFLGLTAQAQSDTSTAAEATPAAATPAEQPAIELGGPLVIPGDRVAAALAAAGAPTEDARTIEVPEAELKRWLIYGAGAQELEARKVDIFIREELEARVRAGISIEGLEVDEQDVELQIQRMREQVAKEYPSLAFESVIAHQGLAVEDLRGRTAQSQLFNAVFLPDDPSEWPDTTRAAILEGAGPEFVNNLQDSYAERMRLQAEGQGSGPDETGQALFKTMLRGMVLRAINDAAEVHTVSDGLPPELVMVVNGVEIHTEDVFNTIASRINEEDVRRARSWVARTELLRQALQASGHYLDDLTFHKLYDEHEEPYRGSPFSLELVARQYKGFPSMESYRQHFRLQESFRRKIADEVTTEKLKEHLDRRAGRLIGLAEVAADVMLLSAFDFENNRWMENGWQSARERATEVGRKLAEGGGENWDELLESYSGFWDPPLPTTPQEQAPTRMNKGRFESLNRNLFLQRLRESDYLTFLNGSSVADTVFFDLEAGQFGGPWRGPYGYYIAVVRDRKPQAQPVLLSNPNHRTMVEQDFLTVRLNEFARSLHTAAGAPR
jgi:hypothetical protein